MELYLYDYNSKGSFEFEDQTKAVKMQKSFCPFSGSILHITQRIHSSAILFTPMFDVRAGFMPKLMPFLVKRN